MENWATADEAAMALKVTPQSLYKLRRAGVLEAGVHFRYKNPLNPKRGAIYDLDAVNRKIKQMSVIVVDEPVNMK